MKRFLLIISFAFVFSFCCACHAVTPGPSTTRSSAAPAALLPSTDEHESVETEAPPELPEFIPETEPMTLMDTESGEEPAEEEPIDDSEGELMRANIELNIRDAAGTDSDVVGEIDEGDTIRVIGSEGSWSIVIYEGRRCYAASKYLEPAE